MFRLLGFVPSSGCVTKLCKEDKYILVNIKLKWSRYRSGVAQRVGRGIALLFHDRGTKRGWVVSSTPRPHFTPGIDPVPIVQEAGWAPGPVWTGGKSRPHRDSIPDRPARSQSLHRLSYPAHMSVIILYIKCQTEIRILYSLVKYAIFKLNHENDKTVKILGIKITKSLLHHDS